MHRHTHRLLSLALVFALGVPAYAFAAPSAGSISDKQAQAARAQAEMNRMQAKLSAGMSAYTKVSGQLVTTRREIAVNSVRLKSLEATLAVLDARLDDRASYMYRTRDVGPLDVLFGATTFDEFLQRFELLSRMALDDASLIARAKSARSEARTLREGLKQRESQLVELRDKSAAEQAGIASAVARQQAYFRSLSADIVAAMAADEAAKRHVSPSPSGGGSQSGGGPLPKPKQGNGLAVATVEGRSGSYYVMADEPRHYRPSSPSGATQASIYSVADNGTGTSSGRPLDDNDLTCACSPALGLGMGTRVALSRGGRRVIVVVTDRGPFSPPGRDFDLTPRAASLLGIDGVGDVHYEVVVPQ